MGEGRKPEPPIALRVTRSRSRSGAKPRAAPEAGLVGLLGLGSNEGDRRAQLQAAVERLPAIGVEVLACSSVYDTDPVGELPDQAPYLNACVRVRTTLEPLGLLEAVKALERALGRARGVCVTVPRPMTSTFWCLEI